MFEFSDNVLFFYMSNYVSYVYDNLVIGCSFFIFHSCMLCYWYFIFGCGCVIGISSLVVVYECGCVMLCVIGISSLGVGM